MSDAPVPGGDNPTPPNRPSDEEEAARKKQRDQDLFGDLEDEEEETPEDIKAERDELLDKVRRINSRVIDSQNEKRALQQQLTAQKIEAASALGAAQKKFDSQKERAFQEFITELQPFVDNASQNLAAIPKAQRESDPKFDKLVQGIEKTLVQLTGVFNKFGAKTTSSDQAAAENPETGVVNVPPRESDPIMEVSDQQTPEEIRQQRDKLLQESTRLVGELSASQQTRQNLQNLLNDQKAEAAAALLRTQNQLDEQKGFILQGLIKEILPIVDNMERGLAAIPNPQRKTDPKFNDLAQGMEKTLGQLTGVFNKFGLDAINPKGQPFDADKHEAISTDDEADVDSDTVVEVAQKGYELNGRVIRTAKVIVKL
jgi:molecular chaperone GrpE